jgi:hypothetical protein
MPLPPAETSDPLENLSKGNIHERAAATRDLEKYGGLDVIPILVEHAVSDPSPAIRHNSADAISDILSRFRNLKRGGLTKKKKAALMPMILRIPPSRNNAVFLIHACIGTMECLQHICAGLRDPRSEVRLGAAIGLLRFCQSASTLGDRAVEKQVVQLLAEPRLSPDAIAHVARACAAVGFASAVPLLRRIDLGGGHGETVAAAEDQLLQAGEPPMGLLVSDGCDAGEYNLSPTIPTAICAIEGDSAALQIGTDGTWDIWEGYGKLPWRRMWFRRVGEPTPGPAFQIGKRTWYMATKEDLEQLLKREAKLERLEAEPGCQLLAKILSARAEKSDSKAWRDIGILMMRAHEWDRGIDALKCSIEGKRTPIDTWYYLGECALSGGDRVAAEEAWSICLQKSRSKTSALAQLCTARLKEVFTE